MHGAHTSHCTVMMWCMRCIHYTPMLIRIIFVSENLLKKITDAPNALSFRRVKYKRAPAFCSQQITHYNNIIFVFVVIRLLFGIIFSPFGSAYKRTIIPPKMTTPIYKYQRYAYHSHFKYTYGIGSLWYWVTSKERRGNWQFYKK